MTEYDFSEYDSSDYKQPYHDPDVLKKLYWEDGLTTGEISDIFDVYRSTIVRSMDRAGVETREMSDYDPEEYTKAAHDATRKDPRLDVSARGYERIRHIHTEFKHHRLLATLLVDDLDRLSDLAVHHDIPVWPDGPDEVAQAVNFLDNLEVLDHGEHMRQHIKSGDIPRDETTGQFKYEQ